MCDFVRSVGCRGCKSDSTASSVRKIPAYGMRSRRLACIFRIQMRVASPRRTDGRDGTPCRPPTEPPGSACIRVSGMESEQFHLSLNNCNFRQVFARWKLGGRHGVPSLPSAACRRFTPQAGPAGAQNLNKPQGRLA